MARRGWSTANFLRYSSGVLTAPPLTLACWGRTSLASTAQIAFGLFNSAGASAFNQFRIAVTAVNTVAALTGANAGSNQATSSTTYATNTWFHMCGVFASATSRAAYLNGGGKGTNATSRVAAGIDRTSIGLQDNAAAGGLEFPWAPGGTGDLAEAAIWNIDLTDAEVALLALGYSPLMVRPANRVGYWPIIGKTSPEINYNSNAAVLSVQGTLADSGHPRIIMPRRRQIPLIAVPAGRVPYQPWMQLGPTLAS